MALLTSLLKQLRPRSRRSLRARLGAEQVRGLIEAGRGDEAEAGLRRCLDADPTDADSLQLLGHLLFLRGESGEAARLIERAIECAPEVAFLHGNLAHVLAALGRFGEAETHARAAVALAPHAADAQAALARLLVVRGRPGEALECAMGALALSPGHPAARAVAATALVQCGRTTEAISLLRDAGGRGRDDAQIRVQRFLLQAEICDWSGDREEIEELIARWAGEPQSAEYEGLHPFVAWHVDVPESARLAVSQGYADRILTQAGTPSPKASNERRARSEGRLRIGYLSADFHDHPTMHLARGLFAAHDRARFEIFAYSLGPDDASGVRSRVRGESDHFVDLRGAAARQCARRIAGDGIDILIDLKGFTLDAQPQILALHPAPVQITWLGYPATLGSGLADYAIVDRVTAPTHGGPMFGEALIRMPHSYQIVDDAVEIAAQAPQRAALGLPESGFVFACFNSAYKIEPRIFAGWMSVLRRVPGSVLWLYRSNSWCKANLRREAGSRGVDPARLIFADTLPRPAHLARMRRADLVLDTHLINAHTGAADALWAGVPLLTCPGTGFPSRVAASALAAAGMDELICEDLRTYEDRAVRLAVAPERLRELRERLGRREGPYFDTKGFVRSLERALELAWGRHAQGLAPRGFDVPPAPC